eukprot:10249774-Ditylum_brightwellii.AAC.1
MKNKEKELGKAKAIFKDYKSTSSSIFWRAIEVEEPVFEPVEEAVNSYLLPALFDAHAIPPDLCNLTSLPTRMGGLGALHSYHEAANNLATYRES